jgi:hypothetical protein
MAAGHVHGELNAVPGERELTARRRLDGKHSRGGRSRPSHAGENLHEPAELEQFIDQCEVGRRLAPHDHLDLLRIQVLTDLENALQRGVFADLKLQGLAARGAARTAKIDVPGEVGASRQRDGRRLRSRGGTGRDGRQKVGQRRIRNGDRNLEKHGMYQRHDGNSAKRVRGGTDGGLGLLRLWAFSSILGGSGSGCALEARQARLLHKLDVLDRLNGVRVGRNKGGRDFTLKLRVISRRRARSVSCPCYCPFNEPGQSAGATTRLFALESQLGVAASAYRQ